jgi:hypothetical protein
VPKSANTALNALDNNSLISNLAQLGVPIFDRLMVNWASATVLGVFQDWVTAGYPSDGSISFSSTITVVREYANQPNVALLVFNVMMPQGTWSYSGKTVSSYFPARVQLQFYNGSAFVTLEEKYSDWSNSMVQFQLQDSAFGEYRIVVIPVNTLDLSLASPTIVPTGFSAIISNSTGSAAQIGAYYYQKNVR